MFPSGTNKESKEEYIGLDEDVKERELKIIIKDEKESREISVPRYIDRLSKTIFTALSSDPQAEKIELRAENMVRDSVTGKIVRPGLSVRGLVCCIKIMLWIGNKKFVIPSNPPKSHDFSEIWKNSFETENLSYEFTSMIDTIHKESIECDYLREVVFAADYLQIDIIVDAVTCKFGQLIKAIKPGSHLDLVPKNYR